jgi:hypothetical protein
MRSRSLFFLLGLVVLSLSAVAFIACSDDDSPTISNNQGSLTDPEFMAVQEQLDNVVANTVDIFGDGLGNISGIPDDADMKDVLYGPGDPSDVTNVEYNETTGWHTITISRTRSTYTESITDRVQFRDASGNAQRSATGATELTYRHTWSRTMIDQSVTHSDYIGQADFTFSGLNTTAANIAGTFTWTSDGKHVSADSTIEREITVETSLTDFVVYKGPGGWTTNSCPNEGSIAEADITMTYVKDSDDPVTTEWAADITFEDGLMTAQVTRNSVTWNYSSQVCTPSSAGN